MILGIPSLDTYRQYKELKKSQAPVSIQKTSPEMDDFVYNKTHNFSSAILCGLTLLLDIGLPMYINKKISPNDKFTKNFSYIALGLITLASVWKILDNSKQKQQALNNKNTKWKLYQKSGLNVSF